MQTTLKTWVLMAALSTAPLAIANSSVSSAASSADSQASAIELNSQGEAAFRARKFDEAIELFQKAIDLDNDYSQAYSNLGLSFQQLNHVAEAMWANR